MASIRTRVGKDGKKSYRVQVRLRGSPAQSATFARLTDAKLWAQRIEAAVREGRYSAHTAASRHTVTELIERYCREVLPRKPRSARDQNTQLKWWQAHIGALRLKDVSAARLTECREILLSEPTRRGRPRAPASVVRYMAVLSHAFNVAVREWEWMAENPMKRVSRPKEPRGRDRFLSEEELSRLLEECKKSTNPYLYPVVVLALSVGMRKGEVLGLRWSAVDLKRGQITLRKTKNDEVRTITLPAKPLEVLRDYAKHASEHEFVFPGRSKFGGTQPVDIRAPWNRAVKQAEIENFRFHDLRHTCASYLAMNGATMGELAAVLGHKTLAMTQRYAHFSDTHTAGVLERMNEKIFQK